LKKIFFFFLLALCSPLQAQWSTSTIAESTLYVCPGFYPGIVTFDDGSSIILGALQSYIFAQKLDEHGYKQWTNPVQVHHNDTSDITSTPNYDQYWGGWISDGDGGVIIFWYDHRGAYFDPDDGYKNNAIYAQRVDKFGNILWRQGGVKVKGPESGLKRGDIVNDGQGGCVVAMGESEFEFPGASNRERMRMVRISNSGQLLWDKVIDSINTRYVFASAEVHRAIDKLFVRTLGGVKIYNLENGDSISQTSLVLGLMTTEKDSILFTNRPTGQIRYDSIGNEYWEFIQNKFSSSFDSIWSCKYWASKINTSTILYNPLVPDGIGGVYHIRTSGNDNDYAEIRHINRWGQVWDNELVISNTNNPTGGSDGHGGVLLGGLFPGRVWRFDSLAQPVWNNPVTMIINPPDAYFPILSADNKGGMIMVYWTTYGGIFAQHSGRYGQVGIITDVQEINNSVRNFRLEQNYPNPFNPVTKIVYSISKTSIVHLSIFNVLGQEIQTLVAEKQNPNIYQFFFDGSNLASGTYFYRLSLDDNIVETKKMLLLR